ncbi:hypothetical protein PIB30_027702 [Stylosanthes scabra]|uniref:Uncharacterized protein n=1 Tax=Stylosanthes scabra TaxID=79078 RepID=A0ABU6V9N3_9FABA|nr:hypothetical protein [Stylosanthes scabra]
MSYWDTRVLAKLDQAECIEATWLLLSFRDGAIGDVVRSRGYLAPKFPRRNLGRASPEEWTESTERTPERTFRRSTLAKYQRNIGLQCHWAAKFWALGLSRTMHQTREVGLLGSRVSSARPFPRMPQAIGNVATGFL